METATIWHEETQARYEDAEALDILAHERADQYWTNACDIEGVFQDVEIPPSIVPHLLTLRQRVGAPSIDGITVAAARAILGEFEAIVVAHIKEHEL